MNFHRYPTISPRKSKEILFEERKKDVKLCKFEARPLSIHIKSSPRMGDTCRGMSEVVKSRAGCHLAARNKYFLVAYHRGE